MQGGSRSSQIGICLNNDKLTPRSSGSGAAIGKGRKTSKRHRLHHLLKATVLSWRLSGCIWFFSGWWYLSLVTWSCAGMSRESWLSQLSWAWLSLLPPRWNSFTTDLPKVHSWRKHIWHRCRPLCLLQHPTSCLKCTQVRLERKPEEIRSLWSRKDVGKEVPFASNQSAPFSTRCHFSGRQLVSSDPSVQRRAEKVHRNHS